MSNNPNTTAQFFQILKSKPENNACFECGSHNPQWASVPLGILICLECAGRHRSLGVHISFVRSLSMDTWNDVQLASMRCGGNQQAREYFEKFGIFSIPNLSQRYGSSAAQSYKDKIKALIAGTAWTDPTQDDLKKYKAFSGNYSSGFGGPSTSSQQINHNFEQDNDELEDFLSGGKSKRAQRSGGSSGSNQPLPKASLGSSGNLSQSTPAPRLNTSGGIPKTNSPSNPMSNSYSGSPSSVSNSSASYSNDRYGISAYSYSSNSNPSNSRGGYNSSGGYSGYNSYSGGYNGSGYNGSGYNGGYNGGGYNGGSGYNSNSGGYGGFGSNSSGYGSGYNGPSYGSSPSPSGPRSPATQRSAPPPESQVETAARPQRARGIRGRVRGRARGGRARGRGGAGRGVDNTPPTEEGSLASEVNDHKPNGEVEATPEEPTEERDYEKDAVEETEELEDFLGGEGEKKEAETPKEATKPAVQAAETKAEAVAEAKKEEKKQRRVVTQRDEVERPEISFDDLEDPI